MTRSDLLKIIRQEVGTKEDDFRPGEKWRASGTNRCKYTSFYNMDGYAWCGMWVSWCLKKNGTPLPTINMNECVTYVPTGYNYWKAHGMFTEDPLPGDLVLYDWQKGKPAETPQEKLSDHIGFFIRWIDRSKGTFEAAEGNTAVGNDSNGGQVMYRPDRNKTYVSAFVRLNLAA